MIMSIKWLAAAALWCMAGVAAATGRMADVTVIDRVDSRVLPIYRHEGRYYVVGQPGHEYQVRVRNRTAGEVLAVVSVDGVNAVTGETAGWEQGGYVLAPYQGYDIRGWRKSMRRIAAFFFTEHEQAYATRTGRPHNVGVIGVAVFPKRPEPAARIDRPAPRPWARREGTGDAPQDIPFPPSSEVPASATRQAEAADPASGPSADARSNAGKERALDAPRHAPRHGSASMLERPSPLGTGHGRSEASHVTYASFERASRHPAEVVTIHYDSHSNLVAMGVIRGPHYARPHSYPTPFPGQFVSDPR
jgi:hypothetical protein